MDKRELAAAMYDELIEMGGRNNLGFERTPPNFALLHDPERSKWVEWADGIIRRLTPSNVTSLRQ